MNAIEINGLTEWQIKSKMVKAFDPPVFYLVYTHLDSGRKINLFNPSRCLNLAIASFSSAKQMYSCVIVFETNISFFKHTL